MSDKSKITLIYTSVALLSACLIGGFVFLGKLYDTKAELEKPRAINIGKETVNEFLQLEKDITLTNQDGVEVSVTDLDDKVWVFAQFFAKCPMCAERNYTDLMNIYAEYKEHPDFMIICMTVDPESDTVEKLQEYAEVVQADSKNWMFLTGDRAEMHDYMRNEMKFLDIRERTDPQEIAAHGKYAHDLGVAVFDKGLKMRTKVDLSFARGPDGSKDLLATYEERLHNTIKSCLEK